MADDWMKGFPLADLQAFAAPFKRHHKTLVFGAFGLVKERDIAEALAAERLVWSGSPPVAVAITKPIRKPSEPSDFRGEPIPMVAPAIAISALAADDEMAAQRVLDAVISRAEGWPVYLEIFEEDKIAKSAAHRAGFKFYASKISAGSEIKGIYQHGLDLAPLCEDRAELATLTMLQKCLLVPRAIAEIRGELEKLKPQAWAQHYSDYNKRKSWTAFALRGYSDDPNFIIKPVEMSKAWKAEHPDLMKASPRWTPAVKAMPKTTKLIKALGFEFDRVRFMRLAAKSGELSRHADITDRSAGLQDGKIARLHIPILTSEAVTFFGWDSRGNIMERRFPAGCLFYLDQRKPHRVTNTDPALNRIHLVLDVVANESVRKMIASGK